MADSKRVRYICPECGSDQIVWDATAEWSTWGQRMQLVGTQDAAYCNSCGSEIVPTEVELKTDA
jgi:predicted RNA-binding Zn-ribbon protein involved in translation (DUF1610 family)